MYVYLHRMLQNLAELVSVQTYNMTTEQIITDIMLLPDDFSVCNGQNRNVLYVCQYQQLRKLPQTTELPPVICVIEPGVSVDPMLFSRRTVAAVSGCTVKELLLMLTRTFYSIGKNTDSVAEDVYLLSNCTSLSDFAEKAYDVLSNPVIIIDNNQRKLAYTAPARVSNSSYEEIVTMLEYIPVFGEASSETLHVDWTKTKIASRREQALNCPPVFCISLAVKSKLVGYLLIAEANHPISKRDFMMIDLLGNLLAVELWTYYFNVGRTDENKAEYYLRELMDTVDDEYAEKLALELQDGHTVPATMVVAAITVRSSNFMLPVPLYTLSRDFSKRLPNSAGFFYQNSVILLVGTDGKNSNPAELLAPILPAIKRYRLSCGISNQFSAVTQLRFFVSQAQKAIKFGMQVDPKSSVYVYQNYMAYHLFECGLTAEKAETFCIPELVRWSENPSKADSDLLETLYMYLKCNCNKVKTAEKLFLHVNTVKYRISQLQQILGTDFDDGEQNFNLMLSLKLMEYKKLEQ